MALAVGVLAGRAVRQLNKTRRNTRLHCHSAKLVAPCRRRVAIAQEPDAILLRCSTLTPDGDGDFLRDRAIVRVLRGDHIR